MKKVICLLLLSVFVINVSAQNTIVRRNNKASSTKKSTSSKHSTTKQVPQKKSLDFTPGQAIDLGLPSGTLWADRNLGASKDVYEGGLFIYGDPTGGNQRISVPEEVREISRTQYDITTAKWGYKWCLPTENDAQELFDNCYIQRKTKNGVDGYLLTGKNGNSIFFPVSRRYSKSRFDGNPYVACWLANNIGVYNNGARFMWMENNMKSILCWSMNFRFTVRPVTR